jgi:hypothetical protein
MLRELYRVADLPRGAKKASKNVRWVASGPTFPGKGNAGPVWHELRGYDGYWAGFGLGSLDGETNPFGKLKHVSEKK